MKTSVPVHHWLLAVISLVMLPLIAVQIVSYIFMNFELVTAYIENPVLLRMIYIMFFVLTFILIVFSIRKYDYWELRNNELMRGRPVNFKIRLDDVSTGFWCHVASSKFLILQLKNNSYVVLDLFEMGNGKEIMEVVEKSLGEKLSKNVDEINSFTRNIMDFRSIKRNKIIQR